MHLCPSFKAPRKNRSQSIAPGDCPVSNGTPAYGELRSAWSALPTKGSAGLYGLATVELRRKGSSPLGIGIAGGVDYRSAPIVSYLRPGSIAYHSDSLCLGDRLLSVNGIRVDGLRHMEILTLLRNAGDHVLLEVEYDLSIIPTVRTPGCRPRTADVFLDKDGGSFGFTLRGGSWGPCSEKSRPLTVTHVRPGGAADREGRIRPGDRIVAINNLDVSTATLNRAMHLLADAECGAAFTLEYDVYFNELVITDNSPFMVEIARRPGYDLGLQLTVVHNDGRHGVVIESVQPASTADRCGHLRIGDEVMSIDGIGLEFTTLAETYQLLKSSNQKCVKLAIMPRSSPALDWRCLGTSQRGKAPSTTGTLPMRMSDKQTRRGSQSTVRGETQQRTASRKLSELGSTRRKQFTGRDLSADSAYARIPAAPRPRKHQQQTPKYLAGTNDIYAVPCKSLALRRLSMNSIATTIAGTAATQVCHAEVMEVLLSCYSKGCFGLVLHRDYDCNDSAAVLPVYISFIERGSPAEKCSVLQAGDRVLAIDDWHTTTGSVEEANYRVRQSAGSLRLTVEFDVMDTVHPSSGVFTVQLAKRYSSLGIELSAAKNGVISIEDVRTGSVAHRCGSLQPGDQLLSIDNTAVRGSTLSAITELLQHTSHIVKMQVRKATRGRAVEESDAGSSHAQQSNIVYSVELSRNGGPLGITIAGTEDPADPVYISQLARNGLAERTGALHIGDRLLAINGESLAGKRVSDAIRLMQQCADVVNLKICRASRSTYDMVSDYDPDHVEKNGTPVQSIDSAVESLEDSPHDGHHQHHNGHHPTARVTQAITHLRISQAESTASSSGVTDMDYRTTSTESYRSPPSVFSPGSEASGKADKDLVKECNEWLRVLESLGSIGENESIRALEDSILQGTVPSTSSQHTAHHSPSTSSTPKPSCATPASTFSYPSMTNTILKHPYNRPPHQSKSSSGSSQLAQDTISLSSTMNGGAPRSHCTSPPTTTDSGEIPFITTPQPKATHPALANGDLMGKAIPIEIHRVILLKDSSTSDFGFSVSDALLQRGVYVNKVRPGGPAEMSGNVKPFDRVLQVNDINVQEYDCLLTVPLLANSGNSITLLLSRDPAHSLERQLFAHIEEMEELGSLCTASPNDSVRHTEV